jgi:hypothetical protein
MDSESVPLPGRSVPVAQLNDALRKELVGNTLNSHSDLLERLLPRERLPFPVDEDLLRRLSAPIGTHPPVWDELESSFCQPPTDFSEAAVCNWLNNIVTTMGLVWGRRCERLWWSGNCGEPLVDSSVHRKPDIVLLECNYHDQVSQKALLGPKWAFVNAFAVVHQSLAKCRVGGFSQVVSDISLPATSPLHHFPCFYRYRDWPILDHSH